MYASHSDNIVEQMNADILIIVFLIEIIFNFSTTSKYISFSKTTIHQALAISVISFENVAYFSFGVYPWHDSCDSFQQTKKETTTELLSN